MLSRAWWLNGGYVSAFGHVSGGTPPAGKDVDSLLSWHGSHFQVCIKFFKVQHGDSVTNPIIIIIIAQPVTQLIQLN